MISLLKKKLWTERINCKQIGAQFGAEEDIQDYLPYARLYENLNQGELRKLLRDAKHFHWQALDLHKCGLNTFPEELGNLPDLKALDLGNHFYDSTRESFWPNNSFDTISRSVSALVNLQALDLRGTKISTLPLSFGNLTNLQRLSLSDTAISALPASFGNLANLRALDLNHTQISALPASFGNLTNLQWLDLSNTQISTLPASFSNLTNLKALNLDDTPLKEKLPPVLYGQSAQMCIRAILDIQAGKAFPTDPPVSPMRKMLTSRFAIAIAVVAAYLLFKQLFEVPEDMPEWLRLFFDIVL